MKSSTASQRLHKDTGGTARGSVTRHDTALSVTPRLGDRFTDINFGADTGEIGTGRLRRRHDATERRKEGWGRIEREA